MRLPRGWARAARAAAAPQPLPEPPDDHHVGIYAGRGRIIHAPHSGAVVRYDRVGDAAAARRLIGS